MMTSRTLYDTYCDIAPACAIKPKVYLDCPNDENAAIYIKGYFNVRAKNCVFNIVFTEPETLFSKSSHTLSLFLLGLALQDVVQEEVGKLMRDNAASIEEGFEYPWMLCCLYHDALSLYEKKGCTCKNLDAFCKNAGIKHTIYAMHLPQGVAIKKYVATYQKQTVEKYFAYRLGSNSTDHGIAAGYLLFDSLTNNYLEHRERNGKKNIFFTEEIGHTLKWSEDQIWVFALAADAIIAHNIWHQTEDNALPNEIRCGQPEQRKLSATATPLSFICSLADTIEPIKRFSGQLSACEVLENVSITCCKPTKQIRIAWTDKLKAYPGFGDWQKNIASLPAWMDVVVHPCQCGTGECYVTIDCR